MTTPFYFTALGILILSCNNPSEEPAKIASNSETINDKIMENEKLINFGKQYDATLFHWTLTGTNTGPGGTGNKVKISGVERWKFDAVGLILESKGSYDAEEYNRQLGVKK